MTYNENLIEQFVFGSIQGKKLLEFQSEIAQSPELASEVQFHQDLRNAILETEIMDLRDQLKAIQAEPFSDMEEDTMPRFDLSHHLNQTKVGKTAHDELGLNGNSLQYIHLENHQKALTERRHKLESGKHHYAYLRNQTLNDQELWNEIDLSLKEDDIAALRSNLQQIATSLDFTYSDFEIDQYRDGELAPETMNEFKQVISKHPHLARQVLLHEEIDEALGETDLLQLRNAIKEIIHDEQSIGYEEIKKIDAYLLNYLNLEEQELIEEQMANDPRYKKEIKLNREINEAILEEDIPRLRASLQQISDEEKPATNIRKFIPASFRSTPAKMIGAAASLFAIISAGSIVMNQQHASAGELYQKYYQPYESTGLYRTSSVLAREMAGVDLYNQGNYTEALEQFSKVLRENPEHPMCNFYSGLSYQEIEEYRKAISYYQNVINEKDNLFIEQAEWYMALCYLKTDHQSKAYSIFNQILDKNGYYSKDAQEIMKKQKKITPDKEVN
ncbi:MAG: tetratricopeptide repeat protein [Prolixibacteraceae bacterium]|nr:tetratricopeptide repeat protein [Prolixibacteraceae bacterium]